MGKYYIDSKDLFETKLAEFLAENEYHKSRRRAFRRKKISANVVGTMRPIFQNAQDNRLLRSFKRKARWIIRRQYHQ